MKKTNTLTLFFSFLIMTLIVTLSSSFDISNSKKGCSGQYYIKGIAYLDSNKLLSVKTIKVNIGEKEILVETDKKGNFELSVSWTNACKSGVSAQEHKEINKRINPEYIYFKLEGKQVKLPNKWENFADCMPDSKESVTWYKDLYFE